MLSLSLIKFSVVVNCARSTPVRLKSLVGQTFEQPMLCQELLPLFVGVLVVLDIWAKI
jgi:hypothetical protein